MRSYALKRFGLRQIRSEVEAQVSRVFAVGLSPTHMDSHQHLHVLPGIIDIVLQAAKEAKISVVRLPRERGAFGLRGVQQHVLRLICHKAAAKIRRAGMRFPDQFWGFAFSGHLDERNLAKTIMGLGSGINEIMSHPGFSDPETMRRYNWHYHWDEEAAALCSGAIRQLILEKGIRLAGFREAWADASSFQA